MRTRTGKATVTRTTTTTRPADHENPKYYSIQDQILILLQPPAIGILPHRFPLTHSLSCLRFSVPPLLLSCLSSCLSSFFRFFSFSSFFIYLLPSVFYVPHSFSTIFFSYLSHSVSSSFPINSYNHSFLSCLFLSYFSAFLPFFP